LGRASVFDPNPINNMRPPEATETGWKDTVIGYPDEITYIRAK